MLAPKLLTKENGEEIKDYLQYSEKYMSLAKFPTLYLWHEFTDISYAIQDGFLYMFECKFDNTALMPFGGGDIEKAMYTIEEYCKKVKGGARLYCVGEQHKKAIEEQMPGRYEFENLKEFSEYVYLKDNLAELPGKKYSKKRNHINKFLREYGDSYEYFKITGKDSGEIERILDIWCMNHDCRPDDTSAHEKNAIMNLLNGNTNIEYKGGAIKINGNIEAFSIGGKITGDMAVVYFEKADTKFTGIYSMMNKLYVQNEWPDIKYINRQEDMGKPGLRKAKESYYPEFLVKNYSLKLK